ncbi:hypothetical protein V6667_08240 [Neisseria leonii]|uniref:Uncharacterized protein n=1 Tax=Neisseria leonii TaxID=2995413 RepID=A0A9X4E240_9NEIS|nr:hypothetical protein [Neisseria sp. 51.81]MDD9328053.1 hypothetical protein [Neisseria sp. 51.81]
MTQQKQKLNWIQLTPRTILVLAETEQDAQKAQDKMNAYLDRNPFVAKKLRDEKTMWAAVNLTARFTGCFAVKVYDEDGRKWLAAVHPKTKLIYSQRIFEKVLPIHEQAQATIKKWMARMAR